ncbi:MAG: YkgJ family cysteine cluster protein [Thermogutta sp.]
MQRVSKKTALPWYHEGLRFECTGCGYCCSGQPGYVYVNQEEIKALAEFFRLSPAEFEERFVRTIGKAKSLIEQPNGDCVFLHPLTRKCLVYELRPRQCRSFPFWSSILKTKRTWEEICRTCPGCGQGPLHSLEEIDRRKQMIDI